VSVVRRAEPSDASAVVDLLSRAFFDDPVASFLFPDRGTRPARLHRFFELQLTENYLRRGVVYVTEDLDGAGLWMPPGAPAPTTRERFLHAAFSFRLGERRQSAHRLTTLLEHKHPREPHWYLGALGVEPAHQGSGVGTALLEAMLERCDRDLATVYLEASRPESARLYARLGFETREYFEPKHVGIDGPGLYLMYRPRSRSQGT
jgi:ribosomal protein S18 acetylase RimI-like enzyme